MGSPDTYHVMRCTARRDPSRPPPVRTCQPHWSSARKRTAYRSPSFPLYHHVVERTSRADYLHSFARRRRADTGAPRIEQLSARHAVAINDYVGERVHQAHS